MLSYMIFMIAAGGKTSYIYTIVHTSKLTIAGRCIALILQALTSLLKETQGLTTNALVILLLVMISHHMPTFGLLSFGHWHNTLLGVIVISSTRSTRA